MNRGINWFRKARDTNVNGINTITNEDITNTDFFDNFISKYENFPFVPRVINPIRLFQATGSYVIRQKVATSGEGFGIIQFGSMNGSAGILTDPASLVFGRKERYFSTKIKFPVLVTTVASDYWIGFKDQIFTSPTDCLCFRYVTTNVWRIFSRSNSIQTTTVTTSPIVANQWYTLEILVDENASSAKYYIDSVLIATHTTNIPTLNVLRATGFGAGMQNLSLVTQTTLCLDWLYVR